MPFQTGREGAEDVDAILAILLVAAFLGLLILLVSMLFMNRGSEEKGVKIDGVSAGALATKEPTCCL